MRSSKLAHPVLVRGFDAVLEGPHPHLLIEHLEGPTLGRLIRRHGPLPMEQLIPLALHVAATLHYMAGESWVHLDVKPDNIVMGIPPRLIDLSIARPFERAKRLRGSIGTDAYMPPEQCDADAHPGEVGAASDVWGLGATLYHAVAGKVPFPRKKGASESPDLNTRFPQLVEDPDPLDGSGARAAAEPGPPRSQQGAVGTPGGRGARRRPRVAGRLAAAQARARAAGAARHRSASGADSWHPQHLSRAASTAPCPIRVLH